MTSKLCCLWVCLVQSHQYLLAIIEHQCWSRPLYRIPRPLPGLLTVVLVPAWWMSVCPLVLCGLLTPVSATMISRAILFLPWMSAPSSPLPSLLAAVVALSSLARSPSWSSSAPSSPLPSSLAAVVALSSPSHSPSTSCTCILLFSKVSLTLVLPLLLFMLLMVLLVSHRQSWRACS